MSLVSTILPFVWHYGIGASAAVALGAVAFFTTFKKTALMLGVVVAAYLVGLTIGVNDGKAYVQSRWDNAERAALKHAGKARDDAELAIPAADPDPPVVRRPGARVVCVDKWDRDCA